MIFFLVMPFVFGCAIGRRWAIPLATIGWPLLYVLDRDGTIQSSLIAIYVVTGALGCAIGVWFRQAMAEETIGSKEEWRIWWHDMRWRDRGRPG